MIYRNPERRQINPAKVIIIFLPVACAIGLAHGGFVYRSEATGMKPDPVEPKVQEMKKNNAPMIASPGAAVVGIFLLVAAGHK